MSEIDDLKEEIRKKDEIILKLNPNNGVKFMDKNILEIFHRSLALSVMSKESPLLRFYEAFMLLKSHVGGDKILRDKYGKNYELIQQRLAKIGIMASDIDAYFSGLNESKIKEEDITSQRFRRFKEAQSRILIDPVLFDCYMQLIKHSSAKDTKIPTDAWHEGKDFRKKLNFRDDRP